MQEKLNHLWKENKGFLLFVLLMFVFRSAFADWNTIPSESMLPTLQVGDRIVVNKMAYDLRVPFTHISLHKRSDPERGDVIIFDSKVTDKKMVKRVVGVPGDVVELRNNRLYINGESLSYQNMSSTHFTEDWLENLTGVEHLIRVHKRGSHFSNFRPVTVPEGVYLAMGDNRDNSGDSRAIGFIPRNEIVGRAHSIAFSLNYDNYYMPRSDRFFQSI